VETKGYKKDNKGFLNRLKKQLLNRLNTTGGEGKNDERINFLKIYRKHSVSRKNHENSVF